jgi:DNA invertase Pin-like site-specific DNA recombinase
LWEGTQEENIADCVSKGRQNSVLPPARFGSEHAQAKLTEADIPEIRKLLNQGIPQRLIALKYGVSQSLISHIKLGKIWQHVEE